MAEDRQPVSRATVDMLDRERKVVQARVAGASWAKAARDAGFAGELGARQAFRRAVARNGTQQVVELQALELERLEALHEQWWAMAHVDLEALKSVLQISRQRVELMGLGHADQIRERSQRLDEAQVVLVAQALQQAANQLDLTPEARQTFLAETFTRLRAIASGPNPGVTDPDAEVILDEPGDDPDPYAYEE